MGAVLSPPKSPCAKLCRLLELASLAAFALIIWTFWYGMNSNKDDIPPLLTHLIPAGHCTCQTSTIFECSSCLAPPTPATSHRTSSTWTFKYGRDDRNEGLAEDQCNAAFPGLFEDIHRATAFWSGGEKITGQTLDNIQITDQSMRALTRAMIYNGSLYILSTDLKSENDRRKMLATLSAIHRALAAFPDRDTLPNIEFVFSVEDKAVDIVDMTRRPPLWTFARKASEDSLWLMPDFGFWAWDNDMDDPHNEIGPFDEVVESAFEIERNLPFADKRPELVWRGRLSFAPKLRRALLDQSRGHTWGAVKELDWKAPTQEESNYLTLEDHCRYRFIAHAEGRASSASLKYRQACRSVVVAHKLQYIQHHHYLLVSFGPEQNYVEVERDFSDLGAKMDELLEDVGKAERIAENSVRTFRERYLTQAAEACYWRALWRAYADVSDEADLWEMQADGRQTRKGVRYETFVLLDGREMMGFRATG